MKGDEMNLCIDIGNTRFKMAIFSNELMTEHLICSESELEDKLKEVFKSHSITRMAVSTTRKNLPQILKSYGEKLELFIELDHNTPIPLNVSYLTPQTLGKDRVAGAVGAHFLYPNENKIIIDAGTCITYDFVDAKGCFHGGNISPGIRMRIKAMHKQTANLPMVDLKIPEGILGKSTEEALQNGSIRGTFYEIESFIRQLEKKYGDSRVIFTGGDAFYFVDYFKSKIFVVQNLIPVGLNQIIKHNA